DLRKAVHALMQPATPEKLVQAIAARFKNLGGLVGSLEQAIDNLLPLGEMVDIASRFRGDVRQFHETLSGLLGRVRGGLYREEEGDAVVILTYFRAKGRQWHSIILPGVNQRVIPDARAPVEEER